MSLDTVKINIDASAFDEAQAKADKLLATLLQIHQMQCKPVVDAVYAAPPADVQSQILAELKTMSRLLTSIENVTDDHAIRMMT